MLPTENQQPTDLGEIDPGQLMARLAADGKKVSWRDLRNALSLVPLSVVLTLGGGVISALVTAFVVGQGFGVKQISWNALFPARDNLGEIELDNLALTRSSKPWIADIEKSLEDQCLELRGLRDCVVIRARSGQSISSGHRMVSVSTLERVRVDGRFFQIVFGREEYYLPLRPIQDFSHRISLPIPGAPQKSAILFVFQLIAEPGVDLPDKSNDFKQIITVRSEEVQ